MLPEAEKARMLVQVQEIVARSNAGEITCDEALQEILTVIVSYVEKRDPIIPAIIRNRF